MKSYLIAIVLCDLLGEAGLLLAAPASPGPLASYAAKPDPSYRWTKKRAGNFLSASYAELILTSQTWRDITWKHQLFVIKPHSMPENPHHALLFITGGSWRDELEQPSSAGPSSDEARLYVTLAELLKTPVAVLFQVPQQPIFGGKKEDAAIAFTFDEFLKTGDPEWPLLLPMVKSAVRGMDAVQEFSRLEWALELKTFTVTGASKRGWTTWLTGATDRRVTAIAPMVIDMLNMGPQLEHQRQTWGDMSYKIRDYTERGLHEQLRTESGRALRAIVDPFEYRQQLQQPKLIILGTNDPYWTLDALNLYWPELAGEKYILYVPNKGHGLGDYGRVFGSINALHQHVANGRPLPKLSWEFAQRDRVVRLAIDSDPPAARAVAWVANSPTKDFREAKWTSAAMQAEGQRQVFDLKLPAQGFAAVLGEAEYASDDGAYFFSTNVRITGAEPPAE